MINVSPLATAQSSRHQELYAVRDLPLGTYVAGDAASAVEAGVEVKAE